MARPWEAIYDVEHCPRGNGGRLRYIGEHSRDRYNPIDEAEPHYECSCCGRWWTVIELRRLELNERRFQS